MSVGAVVLRSLSSPRGSDPGYLPVATVSEFSRYWLPLAAVGGLDLVAGFEPGVALKRRDLPQAVQQLAALRDLVNGAALEPPIAEHLLARVDGLRALLQTADNDEVEEVFIG